MTTVSIPNNNKGGPALTPLEAKIQPKCQAAPAPKALPAPAETGALTPSPTD